MMTVIVVKSCITAAYHVIGHLRTSIVVAQVGMISINAAL